jgi:glutamate-1-semialdehyde 2,1-aminomutase
MTVDTRSGQSVEQVYRAGRDGSAALWARACDVFPQGVSGAAKFFKPFPLFIASAHGAHVVDVDGNEYVDLLMGAGPMLFGHGRPEIVQAVRAQVDRMTNPMMPVERSIELAERIRGHMPYLERLRFTNTGSEATRSAIRVARAATSRTLIAKCEGNYHGADEVVLVSAHSHTVEGPDERPTPVADYAGMAPEITDSVVVIPYNDPEAAAALIGERADELAAVIMEPVAFSSGGGVPATHAFAAAVRNVTAAHGIPLIFDEVLCAYRLGLAGAPAYLGVTPDLSAIGKAVGGGMPLGAFGGRADLMEAAFGAADVARRIFQSGTFTENPVAIEAGHAALDLLEREPILAIADRAGERLRAGLEAEFAARGTAAIVTGVGSILQVHFGTASVHNRRDVLRSDLEATRLFLLGLVAHGVLWPPVHPAVTSSAHTDDDVDRVLEATRRVLDRAA